MIQKITICTLWAMANTYSYMHTIMDLQKNQSIRPLNAPKIQSQSIDPFFKIFLGGPCPQTP